jgi:PKD repeat protein
VYLGGTNQSNNQPLNGALDNIRFYNRKLSNTEFNQLYTLDPICQPQPVASFSVSTNNFCINQTIALTSTSTNSPTTYAWTMAGGSPSVSAIASPVVSYSAAGVYTISLVASNAFGSSAPATQTVNVSTCIGVHELASNASMNAYPNPFTNEFSISGLESNSEIKVYNALGSLILSKTTNVDTEKVNLSLQPQGIYIVRVFSKGKQSTLKMIKE